MYPDTFNKLFIVVTLFKLVFHDILNVEVQNTIADWNGVKSDLQYAQLFRNFKETGTRLALMPHTTLKKTGFLGIDESSLAQGTLFNCENFQNCYAYKFTYNGRTGARSFWQDGKDVAYNDADTFRCGVAAYYDSSTAKCRLDRRAARTYYYLLHLMNY